MTNMQLGAKVLRELLQLGVEEFILCAGARNSPFVHILDENKDLKVFSFFEERCASFFALGRMAQTRKPIAIITTSGTAVAELLPAAVEATYSSLPLILVTADRPKSYRGKGAPQSIEQMGIFSSYVEASLDLDVFDSTFSWENISWKKPLHLNVCFEEPLIDGPVESLSIPAVTERKKTQPEIGLSYKNKLEIFLNQHHPLILVGSLPEKAHETIVNFLKKYKEPVYAEGISNLRGRSELKDVMIASGEQMIERYLKSGVCDAVLRIGGVPTARLWRDLESKLQSLPVFSLSYNNYSGLSRPIEHIGTLKVLEEIEISSKNINKSELFNLDQIQLEKIRNLIKKYPLSEQAMICSLSKNIKDQQLYLGNSMPIREWDSFSNPEFAPLRVIANRGANGIDGQISTFLGWAKSEVENWCIVGDLTAMYDLTSLWVTAQIEAKKFRIVVINNKGGQIFSRMFKKDLFINSHNVTFESWAKMWNWSYQLWQEIPQSIQLDDLQIIELSPDEIQTQQFWKEFDQLWKE